jgi:hypothetical protein
VARHFLTTDLGISSSHPPAQVLVLLTDASVVTAQAGHLVAQALCDQDLGSEYPEDPNSYQ